MKGPEGLLRARRYANEIVDLHRLRGEDRNLWYRRVVLAAMLPDAEPVDWTPLDSLASERGIGAQWRQLRDSYPPSADTAAAPSAPVAWTWTLAGRRELTTGEPPVSDGVAEANKVDAKRPVTPHPPSEAPRVVHLERRGFRSSWIEKYLFLGPSYSITPSRLTARRRSRMNDWLERYLQLGHTVHANRRRALSRIVS